MIYKMTLKDSTDEMTFNLLEVPIVDKDIEGAVDNVTLDGNQYTDYLYLKKQYIQKWSIMCDEEYERLRGFYTRQFDEAEIPTYELYYGETIYNDYTLSGDYILADVQGVEPARMSLAQLNGNATQTTYSGKNLASLRTTGSVVGGVSFSIVDGIIHLSGTTEANKNFFFDSFRTNSGSATFWIEVTGYTDTSGNSSMILQQSDDNSLWANLIEISMLSSVNKVRPVTLDSSKYYRIRWFVNSNTFTNATIKVQLEYGSTKTDFEPYVGGTASPNPDYPQPISVVTGENTVKVLGKNLFDIDKLTATGITISDGTATGISASFNTAFGLGGISLSLSEGQYTFSISGYTDGNQSTDGLGLGFRFRYTDGSYSAWTYWQNADLTLVNKTMTTASDKTPTALHIAFSSKAQNIWHLSNIQLELGSTATSYQAYTEQSFTIDLGNEELAKIGTYQDRIYKDDGKWYVEKQVGKVVLPNVVGGYNSGANWYYMSFSGLGIGGGVQDGGVMSDHFTMSEYIPMSATTTTTGLIATSATNIVIRNTDCTDAASYRTWLASNNTTIYYALATPTTTEITDQTLIDQLEALANVSITTGIHNIFTEVASGNLNPVMIFNFIEVVSRRVTLVPETPVRLTLTDGGIINACGCRKDVQLTMRETIE